MRRSDRKYSNQSRSKASPLRSNRSPQENRRLASSTNRNYSRPHDNVPSSRWQNRSQSGNFTRSALQQEERSSPKRHERSPPNRRGRSPQRFSRSPLRSEETSPHNRYARSPQHFSRSPLRRQGTSPPSRHVRSPQYFSRSPLRRQERSSPNGQERLLASQYGHSPSREHEQTSLPLRQGRSPTRRYERPVTQHSRSPPSKSRFSPTQPQKSPRATTISAKEQGLKEIAKYLKKSSADLGRKPNLKIFEKEKSSKDHDKASLSFGLKLLSDRDFQEKDITSSPLSRSDAYVSDFKSSDFKKKEYKTETSANSVHFSQTKATYEEDLYVQKPTHDIAYAKRAPRDSEFFDLERQHSEKLPIHHSFQTSTESKFRSISHRGDRESRYESPPDIDGTPLPSSFDSSDDRYPHRQNQSKIVASSKHSERTYRHRSQYDEKQRSKKCIDDFEFGRVKPSTADHELPDVSYSWVGEFLDEEEEENLRKRSLRRYSPEVDVANRSGIRDASPRQKYERYRYSPEKDVHHEIDEEAELHCSKLAVKFKLNAKDRSDHLQGKQTLLQLRNRKHADADTMLSYSPHAQSQQELTDKSKAIITYKQRDEQLHWDQVQRDKDLKRMKIDEMEDNWSNHYKKPEPSARFQYSVTESISSRNDQPYSTGQSYRKQIEDYDRRSLYQSKNEGFEEDYDKSRHSRNIDPKYMPPKMNECNIANEKFYQKASMSHERRKFADRPPSFQQSVDDDYNRKSQSHTKQFYDIRDKAVADDYDRRPLSHSKQFYDIQDKSLDSKMKQQYKNEEVRGALSYSNKPSFHSYDSSRRFAERHKDYGRSPEIRNDDMDLDSDNDSIEILQTSTVQEKKPAPSILNFEGAWRAATNTSIKVPGSDPLVFPQSSVPTAAPPRLLQSGEGDKRISIIKTKPTEMHSHADDKREVLYSQPNQPQTSHR